MQMFIAAVAVVHYQYKQVSFLARVKCHLLQSRLFEEPRIEPLSKQFCAKVVKKNLFSTGRNLELDQSRASCAVSLWISSQQHL